MSESVLDETFSLAADVAEALRRRQLEPLLIGALAMAVHQYPRQTDDLDLALAIPPAELERLARQLADDGFTVELNRPDAPDPLGGVLTIRRSGAMPVQVVNFDNSPAGGFPALVRDALANADFEPELQLKVASAVDLILFKLYAGGPRSQLDVLELLTRNPVDLDELRARARGYRMDRQLEALLALVSPTA